jgi:hypothetical protein
MKALFQEIFERLGAQVADLSPAEIQVTVPGHSAAGRLLQAPSDHILSFSSENMNPAAIAVTPGSRLLETATLELAQIGAARHGVLPILYPNDRKTLKNRYPELAGTKKKFSCRRGWQALVRIWLKIKLSGDEVVEMLAGIEIPADMQPRLIKTTAAAAKDVQWVAKSPFKFNQLKAFIDAGVRWAENLALAKAEDLQRKNFETIYPTIERLRVYYQHLTQDSAGNDQDKTAALNAEYRRRIREEVEYARITVKLNIIALETIAAPVQNLSWRLERNGILNEETAVVNLYDGTVAAAVRCNTIGCETCIFGMAASNVPVCKSRITSRKGGVIHAE